MTTNQINYQKHLEEARHNKVTESQGERDVATRERTQSESARHNVATEQFGYAQLAETQRSNKAKEAETERSNKVKEGETERHNRASEAETMRLNTSTIGMNRSKANRYDADALLKTRQAANEAIKGQGYQLENTLTSLDIQKAETTMPSEFGSWINKNIRPITQAVGDVFGIKLGL